MSADNRMLMPFLAGVAVCRLLPWLWKHVKRLTATSDRMAQVSSEVPSATKPLSPEDRVSPQLILDIINGATRSKVLFAAVQLGVFDMLSFRERSSCQDLCHDLDAIPEEFSETHEHALRRLLDACVSMGLLYCPKDFEDAAAERLYACTPVAEAYLTKTSPTSLDANVINCDRFLFPMLAHLQEAVQDGEPQWHSAFGSQATDIEEYLVSSAQKRKLHAYLLGSHALGSLGASAVVTLCDLSAFHKLVDLGGSTGFLSVAVCERYPQIQAVVVDRPNSVQLGPEVVARTASQEVSDRIQFVEGSILDLAYIKPKVGEVDLFALCRVLREQPDNKALELLQHIHSNMGGGTALLVAEPMLLDDMSGPLDVQLQSVSLLVQNYGRERSMAEYCALLEQAGFADYQRVHTGKTLDAVLAFKRTPS